MQSRRVHRLDADDLHVRTQVFHIGGYAGDQTAAAHGHEHRVQGSRMLAQDLLADGPLTGDDLGIVVRVDEDHALVPLQDARMFIGVVIGVPMQHHFRAPAAHRRDFDGRRGFRHDDGRLDAHPRRRQSHPLGMVARAGGNHAGLALRLIEAGDLVVGPAHLEGEHRLQVLALDEHAIAQTHGQLVHGIQRGFLGHLIDPGGKNLLYVTFEHGRKNR